MPGAAPVTLAAAIVIRISSVGAFDDERRHAFEAAVSEALAETQKAQIELDARHTPCPAPERCVAELRGADSDTEVVLIQVLVGPLSARLGAQRARVGEAVPADRVELTVPLDGLQSGARSLIRRLYPPAPAPELVLVPPAAAPAPEGPRLGPWIGMGGSVLVIGAGVLLGALSRGDLSQAQAGPLSSDASQALYDRAGAESLGANLCFSVGAAGAILSLAWLLAE